MTNQEVCYVRWRDAVSQEADAPGSIPGARLVELEEIGFLLDETEDAVQIGMEFHEDAEVQAGRWRLTIPKVSIQEMRVVDCRKAFTRKRIREVWPELTEEEQGLVEEVPPPTT